MDFLMPKLSDTMEEGTVLQWLVADGAEVTKGQAIVEIETDKANMMVEAPDSGTLQIAAQVGDSLPIGAPIATIGATGPQAADTTPPADGAEPAAQSPTDEQQDAAAGPTRDTSAATDLAPPTAAPADEQPAAVQPPSEPDESTGIPTADDGTGGSIGAELSAPEAYPGAVESDTEPAAPPIDAPPPTAPAPSASVAGEVRASPLARRLAEERGIDLTTITGTGPAGRIVREDVEAAAARPRAAPPAGQATQAVVPPAGPPAAPPTRPDVPAPTAPATPGERIALTRLQRTIARRMAESKPGAPHFYLQRDVDVTALTALRKELVAASPEGEGPSITDLLVRAVAIATAERPDAVSRFDGDALVAPSGTHVGVAVAVSGGLLVPVIRDADVKRVAEIAATTRDLVRRSRDGTITPPELEGSVVTISNLGMFGIDRFFAVINPPETAILAVGRAKPTPVVVEGEITVRDILTLSLSVDHRALYGAEAATYLARVAELLERPGSLVL